MKLKYIQIMTAALLTVSCTAQNFREVKLDNPPFYPNTIFAGYEDLTISKFNALKDKYQLDTIFHGETNELKRRLLLRNWIRTHIPINDPGPHPGNGSAESIIDEGLKGNGFHCGHYMAVQNAVMNAYGYVTRCLGSGPGGIEGADGHHGINEIWLNSYGKWFLSDAKYNSHFEKNDIPLSALEVREEYLKNKAADIKRVKGAERTPVEYDEEYKNSKEHFARTYAYIEWDKYNTRYTDWPKDSSILIMYKDEYFTKHPWIWDQKPHWAYKTSHMIPVAERQAIEWTPNVISSGVTINGNTAIIGLNSNTPNFKTYQMKELPGGEWKDVPDKVEVKLKEDSHEFLFQSINLENVAGPEHKVLIKRE